MNSFIYVVLTDGKIDYVNEACHYYSFDKKWSPLMPFIQGHYYNSKSHFYDGTSDENYIEMGVYDITENKKYCAPFVWNHVKVKSIEIDKHSKYQMSFRADVIVYPYDHVINNSIQHTFFVKSGIYFFMNSVLGSINRLLDKGVSINDINFDYFDEICGMFNTLNNVDPINKLHYEDYYAAYYDCVDNMNIEVYKNGCDGRNVTHEWKEVIITLNTKSEFFVHIVKSILKCCTENCTMNTYDNITKFSFETENFVFDSSYSHVFERTLLDSETHNRLKKEYKKILIVEGAKFVNKDSAFEFLATSHKQTNI